jgi:mono/diheme cytochrome c family protein
MSHPHAQTVAAAAHDGPHEAPPEGPIQRPRQRVRAVLVYFAIAFAVNALPGAGLAPKSTQLTSSTGLEPEAAARPLHRVGSVRVQDASAPAVHRRGEQVLAAQCSACHGPAWLAHPGLLMPPPGLRA